MLSSQSVQPYFVKTAILQLINELIIQKDTFSHIACNVVCHKKLDFFIIKQRVNQWTTEALIKHLPF